MDSDNIDVLSYPTNDRRDMAEVQNLLRSAYGDNENSWKILLSPMTVERSDNDDGFDETDVNNIPKEIQSSRGISWVFQLYQYGIPLFRIFFMEFDQISFVLPDVFHINEFILTQYCAMGL